MTRRGFFGTLMAAAAVTPAGMAGTARPAGAPKLKMGVISDIHVSVPAKGGAPTSGEFISALEFFRANGVDVVIVAGDLTNYGLMKELRPVAEAWNRVFPDGRGADGRKVERLFVTGNHDAFSYHWQKGTKRARAAEAAIEGLYRDIDRNWRDLFGEPFEPLSLRTVNGYTIVGAHWTAPFDGRLERFLEKNKAALSPGKPFFYVQHAHPENTIFGSWAWGAWDDHGAARKALESYPNAIAFSGHSHWSLTDERNVWQGAFTSVGTASMRYCALPHGRENGGTEANGYFRRMPGVPGKKTQQGLLVSVWDETVVLERYDMTRREKLDEDWVLPVLRGATDERPFAPEARAAQTVAPQFPAGAELTLTWGKGKDAKGVEEDRLIVSFPAPPSTGWRDRLFDYEVRIQIEEDDTVRPWATKRVYPSEPFRSVRHLPTTGSCVFGACELPPIRRGWSKEPHLRVVVTPFNCFGKAGRPLSALYEPR